MAASLTDEMLVTSNSALISDAKQMESWTLVQYSGISPKRSRLTIKRLLLKSYKAMAHMPLKREKHSTPQALYASTITSVSEAERKVRPCFIRSCRNST